MKKYFAFTDGETKKEAQESIVILEKEIIGSEVPFEMFSNLWDTAQEFFNRAIFAGAVGDSQELAICEMLKSVVVD